MKISLARASILKDWRRNASLIIILSLSGLLLASLVAWSFGTRQAQNYSILQSTADLWITKIQKFPWDPSQREYKRPVSLDDANLIWLHPNVLDVQTLVRPPWTQLTLEDGTRKWTKIIILGSDPEELTYPKDVPKSLAAVIAPEFNIAVARNYLDNLQVALGDTIPTNKDSELKVAAIAPTVLNGDTPIIYMTAETYALLSSGSSASPNEMLVLLKDASNIEATRDELMLLMEDLNPDIRVWTPKGFSVDQEEQSLNERGYMSFFTYIIVGFGFFIFMITNQLMRTNLLAQLKGFGTLHAFGISKMKLALMMLEQGFWLGFISLIGCTAAYVIVAQIAANWDMLLTMPVYGWVACYGLIMSVAMISGFTSVFILRKIELTSLLR